MGIDFLDDKGSFSIKDPAHTSGLYLPLAGRKGLKSAVTPDFGGDAKTDQNHFLIAPKSIMNLSSDRDTRNFFLIFSDGIWSVTGVSAKQEAEKFSEKEDESLLKAGRMWQTLIRTNSEKKIKAETTIFSLPDHNSEIMMISLTNEGQQSISFDAAAAIPIYSRSADNLRDHRHVTSLLNRAVITEYGVEVKPTLSFDERGHQKNDVTYYSFACDENGSFPELFIADTDDYIGEGGTYLNPRSLYEKTDEGGVWKKAGQKVDGREVTAAMRFTEKVLSPGQSITFHIAIGLVDDGCINEKEEVRTLIADREKLKAVFEDTRSYWINKTPIHFKTGDKTFDNYMEWVCFQPELRRLFGCSFLPHHDYGRGGRGWRDLWQDCLALLLTDPAGVKEMLLDNFTGVRMDGTNATIIGDKPGEFKADRNGIPRVWMDHGFWPFLTVRLYMDQTGDIGILDQEIPYFKDALVHRVEKRNDNYRESTGLKQLTGNKEVYLGSVLEHILIETLTAFYDAGEHNNIRLRNADWNDALDMAPDKGESVAFTCGYAGNLKDIAEYIRVYKEKTGVSTITLAREIGALLYEDSETVFSDPSAKNRILDEYMISVEGDISGDKETVDIDKAAELLEHKAEYLMEQIRNREWIEDGEGNGWFNGYYDNLGRRVEGNFNGDIRMMLTGQVFSVMSGTADNEEINRITASADKYLYEKEIGGYKLNTDFKELRTDLGRMFGFSYGDKENGAVFSHMAVMYGNALYKRGFIPEGYKALNTLYEEAADFDKSRIYPGIPEYFNGNGRGLYHYLTGAASWYMMTMVTEVFGVKGMAGDLCIEPKLMKEQFDDEKVAEIALPFRGKNFRVVIRNKADKRYGEYTFDSVSLDGTGVDEYGERSVRLPQQILDGLDGNEHVIEINLK